MLATGAFFAHPLLHVGSLQLIVNMVALAQLVFNALVSPGVCGGAACWKLFRESNPLPVKVLTFQGGTFERKYGTVYFLYCAALFCVVGSVLSTFLGLAFVYSKLHLSLVPLPFLARTYSQCYVGLGGLLFTFLTLALRWQTGYVL